MKRLIFLISLVGLLLVPGSSGECGSCYGYCQWNLDCNTGFSCRCVKNAGDNFGVCVGGVF